MLSLGFADSINRTLSVPAVLLELLCALTWKRVEPGSNGISWLELCIAFDLHVIKIPWRFMWTIVQWAGPSGDEELAGTRA